MKDTFELKLYLRFLGIISTGIAIFLILGIHHYNKVEKTRLSPPKIDFQLLTDCEEKVCDS